MNAISGAAGTPGTEASAGATAGLYGLAESGSSGESAAYTLHRGSAPLLVSLPHVGTQIPSEWVQRFTPRALAVENTDWHLASIYCFARLLGASILVPRWSRFVVDLNRPPENQPMYPGQNNTELVPTRFFSGDPIYREGQVPSEAEVADRVAHYWQPYHQALAGELARLKTAHGHALLWDGHSIQSQLPWLFEGRLPDLNLGTVDGSSCAPDLREALMQVLSRQSHYSHVTDGRFKGGFITRRYGRPNEGVHAVQLEMCFSTYMLEERPPWPLDEAGVAQSLQPLLTALLSTMLAWWPAGPAGSIAVVDPVGSGGASSSSSSGALAPAPTVKADPRR
jgi:N-formylglutamate deformylase